MPRLRQRAAFAAVSLSLFASSTNAIASTVPTQAPSTDPWLALSMLNSSGAAVLGGAPAAALCGAAGAAAAQPSGGCVLPQVGTMPAAQPMSAPPPAPQFVGGPGTPPLPVILVWLAVIGLDIYLILRKDHNGQGNSPT